MNLLAEIIHRIIQLFILVIVVHSILSYFMSPYDPIRRTVDKLIEPLLKPIRRIIPPTGMFDLSPLILIILLYLLDGILKRVLLSI